MVEASGKDIGEVQALLGEGLDHYGRGTEAAAIECWRRALRLSPGHPEAIEYLEAAGAEPTAQIIELDEHRPKPRPRTLPPPKSVLDSPALLELVERQHYDQALEMLYDARSDDPGNSSISRSIRHLKLHLAKGHLKKIGGLDVIPTKSETAPGDVEGPDETLVFQLADGDSSVSDILRISRMGQLRTVAALAGLVERGVLRADERGDLDELLAVSLSSPTPANGLRRPQTPVSGISQIPGLAAALEPERAAPEVTETKSYARLFSEAMDAYFDRDFDRARSLLERCCEERPGDAKARYNLERLKALDPRQ